MPPCLCVLRDHCNRAASHTLYFRPAPWTSLKVHHDPSSTMTYDDLKEHDGRRYTGMRVGGEHSWTYPDGRWVETKKAPDRWRFSFASEKVRDDPAPAGSGAARDSRYHWYILAHQRVRKLDKDTYATLMEGRKYKLGHKRPHWRSFSYEYDDQPSQRERLIEILERALAELRAEEGDPQATLSAFDRG